MTGLGLALVYISGLGQSEVKEFIPETPVEVHATSVKKNLTNFTKVRHGNRQRKEKKSKKKKANAYNKRKQTNNKIACISKTNKNQQKRGQETRERKITTATTQKINQK